MSNDNKQANNLAKTVLNTPISRGVDASKGNAGKNIPSNVTLGPNIQKDFGNIRKGKF